MCPAESVIYGLHRPPFGVVKVFPELITAALWISRIR